MKISVHKNKKEVFAMSNHQFKDKLQEIADNVQAKLCGWTKDLELHEDVENQNERILKLESEAKKWRSNFDSMWSAWHKLAVETHGKEEAKKMAEQLKHTRK